jgi:hypothetical protein
VGGWGGGGGRRQLAGGHRGRWRKADWLSSTMSASGGAREVFDRPNFFIGGRSLWMQMSCQSQLPAVTGGTEGEWRRRTTWLELASLCELRPFVWGPMENAH